MKLMRVTDPQDVFNIIRQNFSSLEAEEVDIKEAGGRCLAEDVVCQEDLPAFNRSTVDGYAVVARETFGAGEGFPAVFEYAGEILMGEAAPAAASISGQCFLVHTGGMLPAEADAVVMVEDTEVTENVIHVYRQVAPGENVIQKGEDIKNGSTALSAGKLLRSAEISFLASMGAAKVKTYRQPVMGVFSTGDELVSHEVTSLDPGQVRDSNTPGLIHLARQQGAGKVINGGILPDNYEEFLQKSREMLAQVDFLVLSGGSSVGTRDFTTRTLQELGKPGLLVEGISIQPGKPTLVANCEGKPVMGLPGHPVSALIVFFIFGTAILHQLAGRETLKVQPTIKASLTRNVSSRSGRTDYVRVKLQESEKGFSAAPVFGRSGMLRTLAEADGFTVIAPEKEGLETGEVVEVRLWN